MVYLNYISCLRYTILVGNPRYANWKLSTRWIFGPLSKYTCICDFYDFFSYPGIPNNNKTKKRTKPQQQEPKPQICKFLICTKNIFSQTTMSICVCTQIRYHNKINKTSSCSIFYKHLFTLVCRVLVLIRSAWGLFCYHLRWHSPSEGSCSLLLLHSPAISLGFTILVEIFMYVTVF